MQNARLLAKRLLLGAIFALLATYVCDLLYFQWCVHRAKPGSPLETFTAPRLFAIAEKNGKVDYELDAQNPEQTITCAQSLFPHAGCRVPHPSQLRVRFLTYPVETRPKAA
jgi:hypothetical protein